MFSRRVFRIGTLAAATLLLESTLTRLLAVAQFYHFAFLVISLALLGFGASGTVLSVYPSLQKISLERLLPRLGVGFILSVGLAYAIVNFLPFDSYSIAWDRRQILFFVLYYLALALPFLISGLGIGAALATSEQQSHLIYTANLVGSGIGALLSPLVMWLAGVPGAVLASALLGLVVAMPLPSPGIERRVRVEGIYGMIILMGITLFATLTSLNFQGRAPLGMTISPYKGLSQARRYLGSEVRYSRWNAISRLDVIANAGTHQLPGLSYIYPQNPPPQMGLSIDADSLQAVTLVQPGEFGAAEFLPEALAFELYPGADVLVLEPGGGLGILQALAGGASRVMAVMGNPLVPGSISQTVPAADIFIHPQVQTEVENPRVFLRHGSDKFDLIFVPLTDAYRPITSGAYSLAEDFSLTIEAFTDALNRLEQGGVFIVSRWLQTPPSESIRLIATLIEALDNMGVADPGEAVVAYRGIQTMTVLVKPSGWDDADLQRVRRFAEERKFDLVWAPDIQVEELNRFNRLAEPVYFDAVSALLVAESRADFYRSFPYAIKPPSDDHPFFFHFFKWEQTPEVLAAFGHIWQPFGGSGYLVLVALLILTLLLSFGLILIPQLFIRRQYHPKGRLNLFVLLYFTLLGIAFLFIELPLIQRWILVLGHPTYAFTSVVFSILLFSGIGSGLSRKAWLSPKPAFLLLVLLAFITPIAVTSLTDWVLGWPFWGRVFAVVLTLAPLGILMGLPFPLGLAWLEEHAPNIIPWAWAVNGCVSVVASVLAAMLSLEFGFSLVLWFGAVAYAGAALVYGGAFARWKVTGDCH
jgi:hypothetical protein